MTEWSRIQVLGPDATAFVPKQEAEQKIEEARERDEVSERLRAQEKQLATERDQALQQGAEQERERLREALAKCRQGAMSVSAENGVVGVNYGDLLDTDGRVGTAALERAVATGGADIAVVRLDDVNAALSAIDQGPPVSDLYLVRRLGSDYVHTSLCRHATSNGRRWAWADLHPNEDWAKTSPWLKPCRRCNPPSPLKGAPRV